MAHGQRIHILLKDSNSIYNLATETLWSWVQETTGIWPFITLDMPHTPENKAEDKIVKSDPFDPVLPYTFEPGRTYPSAGMISSLQPSGILDITNKFTNFVPLPTNTTCSQPSTEEVAWHQGAAATHMTATRGDKPDRFYPWQKLKPEGIYTNYTNNYWHPNDDTWFSPSHIRPTSLILVNSECFFVK